MPVAFLREWNTAAMSYPAFYHMVLFRLSKTGTLLHFASQVYSNASSSVGCMKEAWLPGHLPCPASK